MAGDHRARSPRLLVLGAGPAQLGLLEAARAHGVWTAVADRDPAAPGFALADRRCIVSTEDEPAIERLAAALELDGVIAPGTDWPVAVAARVAEKLGLPHPIAPATAVLATNKLRQRERLAEAGIPQPRWQLVTGEETDLVPPCVVKAPDRQGQKGLSLVLDPEELPAAIAVARSSSRGGTALVEELVDGPEVTVSAFSAGGEFVPLTVTDRLTAAPPAFGVALAHVWPAQGARPHVQGARGNRARPPTELEASSEIVAVARRAVEALGIEAGPTYTQLRVGARGPEVMEVAARLGGGHDAELVEEAVGVDLNGLALAAAFGETPDAPRPEPRVGGAVTRFLVARPGVLESVEVPERLEGVVRVRIYRQAGYVITPLRRGPDRAGALLAVGATREQALARAESAADRIRFVTADAEALV
ncbi:MAG TPA: ATP-grasp domain-containing protein [Gaiellaceae bacterium]|nr:ATP-grasp domain-containing protein [Gaiellaceae bacterium]